MTKLSTSFFNILNSQSSEDGYVLFPFFQIVFGAYVKFIKNIKSFIYIGGIYSFLMSLAYLVAKQPVFCNLPFQVPNLSCNYNVWLFISVRILALYIVSLFCLRYYQVVWQNIPLSLSFILHPQKQDIKSFLAIICFIIINSVAGLSWYLLQERVPNPDWRIELMYFGFIGSGILVPFICLRFYSILADVWNGNKLPSLWKVWKMSRGNGFRLIVSLATWFAVFVVLVSTIISKIGYWATNISFFKLALGEFLFSIIIMAVISFWVNNSAIQKYILNKERVYDNGKTN